jgi:RimJ/RimL family protein N-acetyltransferase
MPSAVTLRPASMADADMLLTWRNDALTRHFSLNRQAVSAEQHASWLVKSLNNPQRQLFIAEYDGVAVGTVRADSAQEQHSISWTLAPEYRGKGLAKEAVSAIVNRLSGKIIAQILPGNIASVRVAEYAGLTYRNTENGIMYYTKDNDTESTA